MLHDDNLPVCVSTGSRYDIAKKQDRTNIHVATMKPYKDQTNMLLLMSACHKTIVRVRDAKGLKIEKGE